MASRKKGRKSDLLYDGIPSMRKNNLTLTPASGARLAGWESTIEEQNGTFGIRCLFCPPIVSIAWTFMRREVLKQIVQWHLRKYHNVLD